MFVADIERRGGRLLREGPAGDAGRLHILQLLGARPRSTGELAGLVTAERQSYYVFYRAVKTPLAEISRGLAELFHGNQDR